MQPTEKLFLEQKQSRELGVQAKEAPRRPRHRGRAHPPGRALHPRGPLVVPLADFFLLYIYIYPYTLKPSGGRIDREFRRRKPLLPPKTNRDTVNANIDCEKEIV